jgi:hypothetical protein
VLDLLDVIARLRRGGSVTREFREREGALVGVRRLLFQEVVEVILARQEPPNDVLDPHHDHLSTAELSILRDAI